MLSVSRDIGLENKQDKRLSRGTTHLSSSLLISSFSWLDRLCIEEVISLVEPRYSFVVGSTLLSTHLLH